MKPVFIDEADIEVESGSGGGGSVHFHRARFLPKGGPDGGDGGKGGDVIIFARENVSDLSNYLHKKSFKAERGAPGGGNQQHGKNGTDLRLAVPVGTQVYEAETRELLKDLVSPDAEVVVAFGGKGGRGNVHYKNPVRQAPRIAQRGLPGQRVRLHLVYKMITDVGLIGVPNAGKSFLLSRITSARPKVADYPYTTLISQLGVYQPPPPAPLLTFVEIPGVAVGKPNRFLRHVERAKVLVILLGLAEGRTRESLLNELRDVIGVLKAHGEDVAGKRMIVGLAKMDLMVERDRAFALCREVEAEMGFTALPFSAETGEGLEEFLKVIEGSCTLDRDGT